MRGAAATLAAAGLAGLPDLSARAGLPETIERIKPSIFAVGTFQRTRNPAFKFSGTGFVVGDGTIVATNSHVVPEDVNREQLETLAIARIVPAEQKAAIREVTLLARDAPHDLALLKIGGRNVFPPLSLAGNDAAREGDTYLFTGFPIGGAFGFRPVTHRALLASILPINQPSVDSGPLDAKTVKRLRAEPFPVYQLDATAYPGNSGSPLYDPESGEVVGVINMVFVKGSREFMLSQPSGISYAIPVRHLRALLDAPR